MSLNRTGMAADSRRHSLEAILRWSLRQQDGDQPSATPMDAEVILTTSTAPIVLALLSIPKYSNIHDNLYVLIIADAVTVSNLVFGSDLLIHTYIHAHICTYNHYFISPSKWKGQHKRPV